MGALARGPARAGGRLIEGSRVVAAVAVTALCAIVYELSIATIGSYFLGNTVLQFSVTIGIFLAALGGGATVARLMSRPSLSTLIATELAIALLGGFGAPFLMWSYARQPGLFPACMYGYTTALGVLLGLELPLASMLLGGRAGLIGAVSRLLTLDYAGSLVGSLLFPLVLLPAAGLVRTAMAVGLLNAAVAIWLDLSTRLPVEGRGPGGEVRPPIPIASFAIAAVLLGGLLEAEPLATALSQQLYRDPVIVSLQSPYQTIAVTRLHDDVRLFLDGQLQFSSLDEYRYHEALVHPAMSLAGTRERVLVLGGGDGLAAKQLLLYPEVRSLTIVEIDPDVTRLFRDQPLLREINHDSLRSDRVHVVNEDATRYLQATSDLYDVIIADFPDPRDPSLERLYTTELYRLIRRRLSADGAFVTQATSPYFAPRSFWSIEATARTVWPRARGYHVDVPSFGDWGFVLAGAREPDAGRLAPLVPTRFLTPSALGASFTFGADVLASRGDVRPNSLVQPVLSSYYGSGWNR